MKAVEEVRAGKPAMRTIAVRIAPVNYLVVLLLSSFVSAFLLYIGRDTWALGLLAVAWAVVVFMALTDRIVFDGRRIRRTGIPFRLWAYLTATRDRIKISDVEMVQTSILRTIKRGSNLIYTYRTTIHGKGKTFTVHSNRGSYGDFIDAVLPGLKDDLLDRRSIELRDHYAERTAVRRMARAASIPSAEILEDSFSGRNVQSVTVPGGQAVPDPDRASFLHSLANQLRISGFLPQAVEAYRRAALMTPGNAVLLHDFALCLKSYAGLRRDARVERRAKAMMRLAERRAHDDGELLSRIGESYFQFGDWRRASAVFRKAVDRTGERFRTLIGLAEVSLHEGKIAHVIHNFTAACSIARTPGLKRWTRQELDYFSRLNDDEEYMELEISRLNLIDTLEAVKRSTLRIALIGFPAILFGILLEDRLVADIGWAVSLISLAVWAIAILGIHTLSARIPYDQLDR